MLALAVTFVTISYGILIFWVEEAHHDRLRRQLRAEIERTARISGEVLAGVLWSLNRASVSSGLEVMLTHEDIVAAIAYDAEGHVLVGCQDEADGTVDCQPHGRHISADAGGRWSVSEEVTYAEDGKRPEKAGELLVYFTEGRLKEQLKRRLERDAAIFLVLVFSIVGGILLATHRAVLTPLARWRKAIRTGSETGLEHVDWASADEIGMLIREYNEKVGKERLKVAGLTGRLKIIEDAFESLERGVCIFDRDFRLVAFNRRYLDLLDHTEGSVAPGMSLSALLRVNAARGEYGSANVEAVIIDRLAIAAANEPYRRERHRPGGMVIEVESSPMSDGGFVSLYTDVTPQKTLEEQLRHLTLADATTGLPNRALFQDRLRQDLALADRFDTRLAVLVVDVDQFHKINERRGPEVGDAVLNEVADRLRRIVRKSDTAARLEGDRFVVIQQNLTAVDEAADLAHRLLGALSRPFEIGDVELRLTASIGISIYPDDDRDSSNLMKHAQLALTAAKAEGRHRYRFFVPGVDRDVARRRRQEEELFNALRERQFVLLFMPRVDLATGDLVGAESRAYWQHPTKGLIPPWEFMDLVEDRGLMAPLTEWVLEESCRLRLAWQEATEGLFRVTVPLARSLFEEGDVAASVRSALEKTSLDHQFLEVEISSDSLHESSENLAQGLGVLKEMGVALILDAFGKGNLPFHSIRRLPADALKIDPRLVEDLDDAESAAIVRTVVGFGQRLDLRVAAAGADTPDQLRRLKEEGCDEAQGAAVGGPLSADELASWRAAHAGAAPPSRSLALTAYRNAGTTRSRTGKESAAAAPDDDPGSP